MSKQTNTNAPTYTLEAGRWVYRDGRPFFAIHRPDPDKAGVYVEPCELDTIARLAARWVASICVYPECCNTRRTRGLCHQHYQTMRSYVRDGKASEADLMSRGLLLPKGQGGSPVSDHSAFLKGSDQKGDAA